MNELLKSLACSGSECLCWILVLFNIFAVFYLVFCSFWKVSKLVKINGWVYSGVLICTTIVVLFFHTCIYTLLATVFTGMMLMAILSIILPQQEERSEKKDKVKASKPMGAYVISETFDGRFVFGLYDSKKRKLADSTYSYDSLETAKDEIDSCRENGIIAETEDRSGLWIQEKYIPKFEVRKCGEEYEFSLYAVEEDSVIHSQRFGKIGSCLTCLEKVKENIGSAVVYMSVVKVSGDGYKKWGLTGEPVEEESVVEEPIVEEPIVEEPIAEEPVIEEPVVEEPVEEEPVVEESVEEEPVEEEPIVEEPVEEEPVIEEPVVEEEPIAEAPARPKKCIVGVVWPESTESDKVYRYHVQGETVEVGDFVKAPTFDSFNQKDVVRRARVVKVEYYEDGDDVVLPKKSIISVEKKSV